jgi:hypothetical protein
LSQCRLKVGFVIGCNAMSDHLSDESIFAIFGCGDRHSGDGGISGCVESGGDVVTASSDVGIVSQASANAGSSSIMDDSIFAIFGDGGDSAGHRVDVAGGTDTGGEAIVLPIAGVHDTGEHDLAEPPATVETEELFGDPAYFRMNGSVSYIDTTDEPDTVPGFVRPRSRSPRHPSLVFRLPANVSSIGELCYEALVGRPRSTELAMCNLMVSDMTLDECMAACRRRVLSAIGGGHSFYIGITEHPRRRFDEHCTSAAWDRMVVLVQASSSRTTAYLERGLIAEFGGRYPFQCLNRGPGGERASAGSPHYLYVLLSQLSLLRRSS